MTTTMYSSLNPEPYKVDFKKESYDLLKKYYATYANYFVKYISAMEANGIKLHSITMQNEPEHGGNNPSLLMNAEEQTEFFFCAVKNSGHFTNTQHWIEVQLVFIYLIQYKQRFFGDIQRRIGVGLFRLLPKYGMRVFKVFQ